jgi:hypothetical protein
MSANDIIVTVNILDYLDNGPDVYDIGATKVGTVEDYDRFTGYMMVRTNLFSDHLLYIPFSVLTHADPREVFISNTKDDAHYLYRDPPPRTAVVEERTDPDTGEDESRAITTEPSGYDGHSIVVDEAEVGELAHHIAPGFHVYAAETGDIGRVKEYDRANGRMVVEEGVFSKHDLVVPVRMVSSVDRSSRVVYLSVGRRDLEVLSHRE